MQARASVFYTGDQNINDYNTRIITPTFGTVDYTGMLYPYLCVFI